MTGKDDLIPAAGYIGVPTDEQAEMVKIKL